jgi:hypothetical protein
MISGEKDAYANCPLAKQNLKTFYVVHFSVGTAAQNLTPPKMASYLKSSAVHPPDARPSKLNSHITFKVAPPATKLLGIHRISF